MAESITDRFRIISQNIELACQQAGRIRDEVNLIVVTKGHTASEIIEVVKAGGTMMGENYPEETVRKIDEISGMVNPIWHMIGHLQSRKIKLIYPSFKYIHSVDSLELAQKLNRFYEEKNTVIDVLFEINIAGEESKFGFDGSSPQKRESLLSLFNEVFLLGYIHPIGLMTMPPFAENPTQNEECYNLCYKFCNTIREKFGKTEFKQLSMGTSADYKTAIKCGATYVRVGEAIMGKRIYPDKQ